KSANDTAETNTSTTFITEAADHVASFRAALAHLPAENLRVRELFDIADACAPAAPHTTSEALAAPWTVVSDPSEVPEGTTTEIWWTASRAAGGEAEGWDHADAAALPEAGA